MTRLQNLQKWLGGWLDRPCIESPVDRRNAPMLQLVLLLIGITVPLLWLHRIVGTDIPWRPGETLSLATGLFLAAMALFCFALVRRGHFQWAIRQMLVLVAAVLLVTYANRGMSAHMFELPLQVMWLFVAGMMIGRRALWAMYAVLVAALAMGAVSEARMLGEPPAHLLGDALIRSVMFLIIAVVVDRSATAMRDSLAEAQRRERQLASAYARLQEETRAREQVQEQLLHAQKVEAIGHMASGVAHDFNNLLGLIMGYAERGRLTASPQELRQVIDGMGSAAQRASAITHKLLNFSRYDATSPVRFDAGEALEEMSPMLRQALDGAGRLQMQLPDAPCPIVFDRAQFGLAILNLTTNAAQAMQGTGGGTLELTLHRPAGAPAIEIILRDDGPGIPADTQARIFEPFFTTKPAGQGTGLGLPIVKNLVTGFGGRISLESTPGTGTTFRITLPLALENPEIPAAPVASPA